MIYKKYFSLVLGFFLIISFAHSQEAEETGTVFPPQAIIIASYRGDENMVREILAAGTDKNVRDALGATALHAATYQLNLNVVKLLVDHGFDLNAQDTKNGYTPLHTAVAANNVSVARLLVQYKANKDIRDLNKQTPLEKARREDKQEMVRVLIR